MSWEFSVAADEGFAISFDGEGVLERDRGITVVREGIPDTNGVKLMTGNIIRMTIAVRIIPLRKGAAFWRNSLAKTHPRKRIKKEFIAKFKIRSAITAFSR